MMRAAKFFLPPAAILGIGVALLAGVISKAHDVDLFRHASTCGDVVAPGANCYRFEQATITRIDVLIGRASTTIDLDLQAGDQSYPSFVDPGGQPARYGLATGSTVTVQLYHGLVTRVDTPGYELVARDNPVRGQNEILIAAVIFLSIGGVYLWAAAGIYRLPILPPEFAPYRIDNRPPLRQRIARLKGHRAAGPGATSMVRLRPSAHNGPPLFSPRPMLLPALIVLGVAAWRSTTYLVSLVLVGALLTVVALYRWLFLRTAAIIVTSDWAGTRNWLFSREVPRHEVAAVVLRAIDRGMRPTSPRIFLVDRNGRCRLQIAADFYSRRDADQLAAALDVPIEGGWNRVVDPQTLHAEIPGSAGWPEQHPLAAAIVLLAGTLGIVIGLLALTGR